jgi:hypothetical protein
VDTNDLIVVIIMTDLLSQKLWNWVRQTFRLPSTKYKKKVIEQRKIFTDLWCSLERSINSAAISPL